MSKPTKTKESYPPPSFLIHFSWCGMPIPDIEEWARERGEDMVVIKITRPVPGPLRIRMAETVEYVHAPSSFWESACFDLTPSIREEELGRYSPTVSKKSSG